MRSVSEIIAAAGGFKAIHKALDLANVAYQWPSRGIPPKHFSKLRALVPDLTFDELAAANDAARSAATGGLQAVESDGAAA